MTDKELKSEGFTAVITTPDQIPVNAKFLVFCEENRCGKYNANYSCPLDYGTVEELYQKMHLLGMIAFHKTVSDQSFTMPAV